MNNNIKIEDIKSEPLTTEQKEFLVSGLFSMMSNENNQFVSKEKYDNLQSKIDKVSEYVDKIYDVMDYRDYPPYLDEIYYTLHPELKEEE